MDTPRRRPGNRSRSAPRGSDHCRAPRVGAFVGLDLFQDPSLFAREWPKLLRAQALETYGRRVEDKTDERRQRALLSDLVRAAAEAGGIGRHGIGAGWLVEFRASRLRGSALVAEGQVVHAAVL